MHRRQVLSLAATGVVGSLAGCGGGGGGGSGDAGADDAGGQALRDHPAAADIDSQPTRGTLDGHVVLSFEDPSCSLCRRFNQDVVPEIRSNVVEPGLGAYAVRSYPVIYPWGEPATQALASTFARSDDAFWSLHDHYFATQDQFTASNVLDLTASFLDEQTDLDGSAVAEDARNEAHDETVRATIAAAEAAELPRQTPILVLFRDGQFVSTVNGSVSYDLIAETLGVDR